MDFISSPRRSWALFYSTILLALLLFAVGLLGLGSVSTEARIRDVACLRLLADTTDGRQALVSSVWWAPLPTLARLPFVFLIKAEHPPVASILVSALFGAGTLALLSQVLLGWNSRRSRLLMMAGLAVNPFFLAECVNGSSGTLVIFLTVLVAYGLLTWTEKRSLKSLSVFGLAVGLLLISSAEMVLWVVAALFLLVVHEERSGASRAERKAVILLAVFPAIYAVGIWVLANWLIMGDALYFVRSLLFAGPVRGALTAGDLGSSLFLLLCGMGGAVLTGDALLRRDGRGLCLGLLAVAPLGVAWILSLRHYLWETVPLVFSLLPLGVLSLGYLLKSRPAMAGGLRTTVAAMPLIMAGLAWQVPGTAAFGYGRSGADQMVSEGAAWQSRIGAHVLRQSPFSKVFVCGYGSFGLLGARDDRLFVHSLDFNFYRAAHDYVGHSMYMLVHRPVGRMAMDSIHWKYDMLYTQGAYSTLYYGDWGDWRLFEIIRGPREETDATP